MSLIAASAVAVRGEQAYVAKTYNTRTVRVCFTRTAVLVGRMYGASVAREDRQLPQRILPLGC